MAVVFPEALPFPLIGPFDGPRNRSRHMPITREMLEELQPIVLPLSGWMFLFKQDLHPYGGELQFAKDQDWRDGPTIYKPTTCSVCEEIEATKGCLKEEDSFDDSLFEGWNSWNYTDDWPADCLCTFLNPEPEWASDDSPLYVQYCDAFHRDLKYVYRLNGWAFCGTDDAGEPRPWATIDVIMQTEKNRLLPWGGFMGFTWPKLSPWERPELQDYGSVENDDDWVPNSCPWYREYLEETRVKLWAEVHQYNDPDPSLRNDDAIDA